VNVRSLTVGAALPGDRAGRASLIERLGEFVVTGRAALQAAGFAVQVSRLSTQPIEQWLDPSTDVVAAAIEVGKLSARSGIEYFSLGTMQAAVHPDDSSDIERLAALEELLPQILLAADTCFASIQVGMRRDGYGTINLDAVKAAARVIRALAEGSPDGFANLRFAAAANCPPHVPFFPASYYVQDDRNSGDPEFGLALEAADLAVRAFSKARSHEEARENLLALLSDEAGKAAEVCTALSANTGYTFTGLDISMAPHPSADKSIARALEMVSGGTMGGPGTLTAAAFVTSALKEARNHLPTVGYSGLMLPVLEDQTLADRAAEGLLTIDTLLLMSAVCGLGLDTLPLPGDVTLQQLEAIILDVASLAVRLDKPLTARLLPVPGKQAGDPAEWPNFPFFAKGKVMAVAPAGEGAEGLLKGKQLDL
jgi:uncharacterized protein (UPF0210 family)